MIPMTIPDWMPRECAEWIHMLVYQSMFPVAIIAVDNPDNVQKVGMAGTPDMTPDQLVTLLEECLVHARKRVEVEQTNRDASRKGGAT